MKWSRAISVGILVWILIFLEVSFFKLFLGLEGAQQLVIHYFFLLIFGLLAAWMYYRTRDHINGFLVGLSILLIGIIIDLIVTVPFFTGLDFFLDPFLWAGFLELVVVIGLYDLFRSK